MAGAILPRCEAGEQPCSDYPPGLPGLSLPVLACLRAHGGVWSPSACAPHLPPGLGRRRYRAAAGARPDRRGALHLVRPAHLPTGRTPHLPRLRSGVTGTGTQRARGGIVRHLVLLFSRPRGSRPRGRGCVYSTAGSSADASRSATHARPRPDPQVEEHKGISARELETRAVVYSPRPGFYVPEAVGFRWMFLMRVAGTIAAMGGRLRRCEECRRMFLGVGRQEYDSPACSALARARRFHGRHSAEELSERRHQRYRQRKRQQLGANVRVKRRKRASAAKDWLDAVRLAVPTATVPAIVPASTRNRPALASRQPTGQRKTPREVRDLPRG